MAGYDVVTRIHNPTPGHTDGVSQQRYEQRGDSWVRQQYPGINFVVGATVTLVPTATPTTIPTAYPTVNPTANPTNPTISWGDPHTLVAVACSVIVAVAVAAVVAVKCFKWKHGAGVAHGYAQLEPIAEPVLDDDVELLDYAVLTGGATVDDDDVDDTIWPLGGSVPQFARLDPAAYLPEELIAKILGEVGPRTLYLRVPAVSRRWRKLCRRSIAIDLDMGWARFGAARSLVVCRVTDAGLIAIVTRFRAVRTANLAFCVRITDAALRAIASLCPQLKELELLGCRALTHRGLEAIAEGCPAVAQMAALAKMAERLGVSAIFKYQLDWEAGRYGNHVGAPMSRDSVPLPIAMMS